MSFLPTLKRLKSAATSSLHQRLVLFFGLVAVVPAALLVFFSTVMLHYGVQVMFGDQVKTAVDNAQSVAQAYLDEHRQTIRADVMAAATDIDRQASAILANPADLNRFLRTQAFLRNLAQVVLMDDKGRIIAHNGPEASVPDIQSLALPIEGEIRVFTRDSDDKQIHALVRLRNLAGAVLYANRDVDPKVLSYLKTTRDATTAYQALDDRREDLQTEFLVVYLLVCGLVVSGAIGAGLYLATQLSRPIERLIDAADQVRAGNLDVQVPVGEGGDDFAALNRTFNHMTADLAVQRRELAAAERKAAWADVARRVAHEIKNPLTPIQLSAERLRRRFLKNIPDVDQPVYTQCIDTIVRHVGDIGRMVGEFASFARMPEPVVEQADLGALVRDIVAMHDTDVAGIHIGVAGVLAKDDPVLCLIDPGQMRQAITNLVLNACESVRERVVQTPEPPGRVLVYGDVSDDGRVVISVLDNGIGFPTGVALDRLGEPYVTFKENGTGLGLAIVKKIIHDHKGAVRLNGPDGIRDRAGWGEQGAVVSVVLPLQTAPLEQTDKMTDTVPYAA
jgi:nitrogen fixation/metabolism regulation signal transduction histidine kinase